ncbi:uncharacterized protein [Palaemon carinicauda]|uniref:uncharacterized protein n=1 Tax=Palaemon carinicauda TaxID=392227 RepID=UPI0035B6A078
MTGISSCDVMVNGKKCGREYHKMLHSLLYKPTTFTDVTSNLVSRDGHLLMVSGLRYRQNDINVLWDSGSNVSLITHQKVKELELNGRGVQITITKVGNKTETVSSKEYTVPVVDNYGVKWEIIACGIDEITTPVEKVDMNVVSCLFKSLNGHHISRPCGVIHLLIGIDYCVLMPQVIETNGNLQLMLNQFSYVVRGFHPQLTSRCYQSNVSVRINHIDITDVNEITSVPRKTIKDVLDNYLSIESLGTSCYPKCSGCICGNCTPGQSNCTLKEERELAQISHGLSFNSDKNRWSVAYPWVDVKPDHYMLTCVPFGDKPSRTIAMLALKLIAEMSKDEYPVATQIIVNNSYVDDILGSCDSIEIANELMKQIERIIGRGGFKIKHWILSGNANHENPMLKKIHTEPNLAPDDLMVNVPQYLTRRMLLSQIASQYDPLGLVCPVTLRAKLMMRQLISRTEVIEGKVSHYDWDSAVSTDIRNEWLSYFQMLFELQSLSFPRCVKVEGTIGKPMLVIFSDGSNSAYGACAYVRWELSDGGFCSRLLMVKSRIAPLKQLSIPRIELCGALVAARMRETIVKEMNFEFESVMHIVDSAIVRAQIQKESYDFGTFTATKIAEIQSKTDVGEWSRVSGDNNPADLITKPAKPIDLGQESMWQMGPAFLTLPISKWPIRKDHIGDLPDKGIFQTPNIDEISQAEMLWVREIQSRLGKDWESRYRRLGPSVNKDGLIVIGQRIPRWLKNNYDQDEFLLLSPDHEFVKLYVKTMHRQFHSGVENTLAKIQSKFCVPRVRNMIKSVKFKCITCRKLTKEIAGQVMGQLPLERLKPSPPFAYTALDLYGPIFIRDTVKGRTKGKAYGVIFNCLSTRAVHLDLIEGYSAKDFLDGLRRFVSLRGCPKEIYSDRGTQLTAAEKELRNATEIFKIKWIFNASADAPWQNGVSESLIKSVKRSLTIAIGDNILTFSKLQTGLYEIANLLNERPIGIKPGCDPELGRYLCPNDLLLGRAQNAVLKGEFERFPSHESRLKFHEGITDTFWRKWMRDFFPTMLIRQKWHVEKRNLQVGDLVLFQDSNVARGNWKLAEVLLADKGKDEKVRNVTLRYKPMKSGRTYKGERDVIVKRSAHRSVVILPIEERLDLP